MESTTGNSNLMNEIERFLVTSKRLYSLQFTKVASQAISSLSLIIVLLLSVVSFLFFINVGMGLWIGGLLESNALGFVIVGLFYFLLTIIVILFKESLILNPINDIIINTILKHYR